MSVTTVTVDEGYEQGWKLVSENGEMLAHIYLYNQTGNIQLGKTTRICGTKRTSDVGSQEVRVYSDHAWPEATTYKTGGTTRIAGGIGVRKFTITNYAALSGAEFRFCVNGHLDSLIAGTDFVIGGDNATAAANLAQAIIDNQVISLGTQVDAWAVGNVVYVQPHQHQHWFDIYVNHAGATYESSLNGEVSMLGSYLALYRDGLTTNDLYPCMNLQARKWATDIGNGFGPAFNFNISEINETLGTANTIGRIGCYRDGADNTGTFMFTPFNGGSINRSYYMSVAAFYPYQNGLQSLGKSNLRFLDAFLTNNPNVSSDISLKEEIRDLHKAEKAAYKKIKVKAYRLKSDRRKIRIGVIAQDVIEAFASEGLNAFDYNIIEKDENGLLSVRYAELTLGMAELW